MANVRSAYAEIMTAANSNEKESSEYYDSYTKSYIQKVQLTQKKDGWESSDSITIGGINSETDNGTNWKNIPSKDGTCVVYYTEGTDKAVIDWKGVFDTPKVQEKKQNVQSDAMDNLAILKAELQKDTGNGVTLAQKLLKANRDSYIKLPNKIPAYFKTSPDKITTMDKPTNGGDGKTWINFTLDENGNLTIYNFANSEYTYSTSNPNDADPTWQGNAIIR